jgi:hypothetical protein
MCVSPAGPAERLAEFSQTVFVHVLWQMLQLDGRKYLSKQKVNGILHSRR